MSHIFISHVEEDAPIASDMARLLEARGYSTWYYQRDTVPGAMYLTQVGQAIDESAAVVLIVSPSSLDSHQVTSEIVRAFESGRPFVPVLSDITDPEFKARQPLWRQALSASTSIVIPGEGVSSIVPRIIDGLTALGIQPEAPAVSTSQRLADKTVAARPSIEGERKQVTVLFADVSGFTSMSEPLDPEETQDLIRPCIDLVRVEIHRYEGTVAEVSRNGVMALFGAPVAHEDDPQRALHAALGIQERLEHYADELRAKNIEFEGRIGVNTGLVVVGQIRDDLTMEFTPVGSTVDLAAEMNRAAEPGSIRVSENTCRIARDYFHFRPGGELPIRGRREPVKAYLLAGSRPVKTRLEASIARGLTPFVGRSREIAHLAECFERTRDGQGQVVGVVGEPGVGKSRLIFEFIRTLASEEYTYLEGRCLHYGSSVAYLPIIDILKSYFDIRDEEEQSITKRRMTEKLDELGEDLEAILPPLYDILSLRVDDEQYLKLEPLKRREKIFEAVRNLLICESRRKPLILAIEDLHWIDRSSEEFLGYFISGLATTHILLIPLYRPEYRPAWVSKTYYTQVLVDELPVSTSGDMVQAIMGEGEVQPELRELILDRAAGNPMFMEEFARTLLESGYVSREDHRYLLAGKVSDIQVPGTIQGIIAARMDRLDQSLKSTMQVASVIGRDFSLRVLEAVTGLKEELRPRLLTLQELEFIYEKSLFPDPAYTFKHALTQDVAYESMLVRRRKEVHRKVGRAVEELYAGRLEEYYEILAHHYSTSEDLEKACEFLKLSGDKAAGSYSNWEAFRSYREAIELLGRLPETESSKTRTMEVLTLIAVPMLSLGFPDPSLQILQQGEHLARQSGDYRTLASIHGRIGDYYSMRGDPLKHREYAEQALREARETEDVEVVAPMALHLFNSCVASGDYAQAVEVARPTIDMLERTGRTADSFGTGWSIYYQMLGSYGHILGWLGDFDQGEAACAKALRCAREVDEAYGPMYCEFFYAWLCGARGDGRGLVDHCSRAARHAEERQFALMLPICLGGTAWGHYLLGDLESARRYANKALEAQSNAGILLNAFFPDWLMGLVHMDSGDLEKARRHMQEAIRISGSQNEKHAFAASKIYMGKILARSDISPREEARACIEEGIEIFEGLQMRPWLARGYLFLGELCASTGQLDDARAYLEKAESMSREMGMDYWLRRTQEVLRTIEG